MQSRLDSCGPDCGRSFNQGLAKGGADLMLPAMRCEGIRLCSRLQVVLYIAGAIVWNLFATGERVFD